MILALGCLISPEASPITANFTFSSGCLGIPTTLTSTSTPKDSILALLWDLDTDGLFDDGSGETVTWTFPSIGNHPVGLQVVALNGDINAIYKEVPVAGVYASFSFSASCMGEPVSFTNLSTVFADSVMFQSWNFGDGSSSVETKNPVHTYQQTGTFPVSLWLITELGCQDSLVNEIVIQPPPEFTLLFTGDTATFHNDTILVEATGDFDSVLWNGNIPGVDFMITQAGTYTVSVFRNGCFTTTTFTISDHTGTKAGIMTLFTPNGDGYNDFWVIRNMEPLGTSSVWVFDSWGNQVYENEEYQNTWDGRSDKGELPSGPYYYVIRFSNGQINKGAVNILR
ncbi:MAG: gliding motility-associated C-terminal domain-containing protein [Bacteroidota bacterium]